MLLNVLPCLIHLSIFLFLFDLKHSFIQDGLKLKFLGSLRFLSAKIINVSEAVFNLSNWEAEMGGSLWAWSQAGLHGKFQDSQELLNGTLYENNTIQTWALHLHVFIHVCKTIWDSLSTSWSFIPKCSSQTLPNVTSKRAAVLYNHGIMANTRKWKIDAIIFLNTHIIFEFNDFKQIFASFVSAQYSSFFREALAPLCRGWCL